MSEEKPTYEELSLYGKCIVDQHVNQALNAPFFKKLPPEVLEELKKDSRDIVLDTVGIDGAPLHDTKALDACEPLKPSGVTPTAAVRTKSI